jgi:hypothetical protein
MTMTEPALPNTVWQAVGFSSRAAVNTDNHTTGQYYWLRVKAFGRRENSGFSDMTLPGLCVGGIISTIPDPENRAQIRKKRQTKY